MSSTHRKSVAQAQAPSADPAARTAKRGFNMLSASSVGLEMGISVLLGVLGGLWIDSKTGTSPLFLLIFMVLGLIAGFRGVIRAMRRADRAANNEAQEARHG